MAFGCIFAYLMIGACFAFIIAKSFFGQEEKKDV